MFNFRVVTGLFSFEVSPKFDCTGDLTVKSVVKWAEKTNNFELNCCGI